MIRRITNWLEIKASSPTYSGWVLAGISICFFGAAINTMAGWLYVISGVSFALLGIAATSPTRSLPGLTVNRRPIQPVTAGDDLVVELEIINPTKKAVNMLQVEDILPFVLGKSVKKAIETIAPRSSDRWLYYYPTQRRGIYQWHTVEIGSGAPLGLFWSRRQRECNARAIVYPTVLPLGSCPLVDELGQDESKRNDFRGRPLQNATEGLTRALRPYRLGDPMRLIHWRTSARYGELRVRELEKITGGEEIVIALDSAGNWEEEDFEQAVIAAASLYFYAQKQEMQVQLWTTATGLVKSDRAVLETLAATTFGEEPGTPSLPSYPFIWLTQNPQSVGSLPQGSRWVLWQKEQTKIVNREYPGIAIQQEEALQAQLQKIPSTP